ncbi:cupin domain-containing protein [Alsobacter sp. KACC 23698]|uniref:Cupin domain-containing protein n=1 Tax=Alsobacter sp. KACC 23698 TaxID=3149229 RepID=A0AAU7J8Z7_9HYPH
MSASHAKAAPGASASAPTCRKVRPGAEFTGKQALPYKPGVSAETVGSKGIHLQMVTIPPGGRAKAHKHASHETALYVLSGQSAMYYGDNLEHHMEVGAGDYLYIPADVPHLPYNPGTEPCVAIISRTDPNEQESVVLLPELDRLRF